MKIKSHLLTFSLPIRMTNLLMPSVTPARDLSLERKRSIIGNPDEVMTGPPIETFGGDIYSGIKFLTQKKS